MELSQDDIKFSKSFIQKAKDDLKSSKILFKAEQYVDAIYHSQQAAEKIAKALLVLNNKFVRDHIVSHLVEGLRIKELDGAVKGLRSLEEHWVRPRYPEISEMEIWNPLLNYKKEDAKEAIKKAEAVLENIMKVLKERFGVE